ncbi:MAG: hypothetical protein K2Y20_14155 [Sphingomonas sp.]|nr:hypothetical protein [Sphingomonas sp.]
MQHIAHRPYSPRSGEAGDPPAIRNLRTDGLFALNARRTMWTRRAENLPLAIQRSSAVVRLIKIVSPANLAMSGRCHAIEMRSNRNITKLAIDIFYR